MISTRPRLSGLPIFEPYAVFVIIAQILQNLTFPQFTAIIKTQNTVLLNSMLNRNWKNVRVMISAQYEYACCIS